MLTDRQKLILKAIIEEYIETNEPVGSKVLTDKPFLNFSSATLRYDMQSLEEDGYLVKTHTSSGRVPSQKGYSFYVENLITRDDSIQEFFRDFDEAFADKYQSRDDTLKRVVDLLSAKTGYMAVLNGSSANYALVKKLEIVPLGRNKALLLAITSNGSVQNQLIDVPEYFKMDDLVRLIDMFDNAMYDKPVFEIRETLTKEAMKPRIRQMVDFRDDVLNFIIKCFARFQNADFVMSGLSKMFEQPEFHEFGNMQRFVDMLDSNILPQVLKETGKGLTIRIGTDNENDSLSACSIISIPYYINHQAYGSLAIIGPVRMKYRTVIPTLEYVAKSMSKLYK
jgi:heat-inducible transcriptional repressor